MKTKPESLKPYLTKYIDGYSALSNSRAPSSFNALGAIPISEIAVYVERTYNILDFDFLVKICKALDDLTIRHHANKQKEG